MLPKIWAFIKKYKFLLLITFIFILLRLPSLLEPYWVGDEGIYAAVAHGMRNDQLLYVNIWDHKPPGIYLIYYVFSFFGENQLFWYKLLNLILGLSTGLITYRLTGMFSTTPNKAKDKSIHQNFSFLLVVFLLGTPYLEGNVFNAENIFIFLSALAVFLYLKKSNRDYVHYTRYIIIGFIFGIGITIKMHPAFDLIAILSWIMFFTKYNSTARIKIILTTIISASIPLFLFAIYYLLIGHFSEFLNSVIIYNFEYTNHNLTTNALTISLPLKILLFAVFFSTVIILYKKKKLPKKHAMLILWLLFTLAAVYFPNRHYLHYSLQFIVPISIFIILIISKLGQKISLRLKALITNFILITITSSIIFITGTHYEISSSENNLLSALQYYKTGYAFLLGQTDQTSWYEFFYDAHMDEQLVYSLKKYQGKEIFLWMAKPWVYPRANIKNPTKYLVDFHINNDHINEVIEVIEKKQIEFIVIDLKRDPPKVLLDYISQNYYLKDTINDKKFLVFNRINLIYAVNSKGFI